MRAQVVNSALTQALIAQLEPDVAATAADLDRLSLSVQPFLEKNIQSVIDCVDDLIAEQGKVCVCVCTCVRAHVSGGEHSVGD